MKPEYKIFRAFFEEKKESLYYNQIKEKTGLSHSSVQNALNKLEKNRIISKEKTKGNVFYKIIDKKIFSLRFSEIAVAKLNNLNTNTKIPLKNFIKRAPAEIFTIVLFGSAAQNKETPQSDIDLLVVSNEQINLDQIKKDIEITSKHPISIFRCSIKEFIESKDHIILQAKNTGFPIYKEQNFFEAQINEFD